MKGLIIALCILITSLSFGQSPTHKEKYKELEPDVWMGIWDKVNSDQALLIDSLSYDEIPKYLEFRGTVVEALRWTDSLGVNILIQTVTGQFNWKDYLEDSTDYMIQDKSELYAYLFRKPRGEKHYKRIWRLYDYTECFGVDWYTGFIPRATSITDVDKDGISEISMPYVSICRGGMDPGSMKIILYEGSTKYALRGYTQVYCGGDHPYEGSYKASDNLKAEKALMDFLKQRWDTHKCENRRFY